MSNIKLKEEYRYTQIINKSRFIGCAKRCTSEEEARLYIDSIRKEFSDATHVCTAFSIGQIQRSNDDHEPSGTAGIPILESIKNSNVDEVCICIVRYFGGVKLGASGLIRAYSGTTTDTLANAPKIQEITAEVYTLTFPYDLSGTLENYLRNNTTISSTDYTEQVTFTFSTTDKDIIKKVQDLTKGKVVPELVGTTIIEADI